MCCWKNSDFEHKENVALLVSNVSLRYKQTLWSGSIIVKNPGVAQATDFVLIPLSWLFSSTRLLLLNTFDIAEDNITLDTALDWVRELNMTYPEKFAEIADQLQTCDLEKELDTVSPTLSLLFTTTVM